MSAGSLVREVGRLDLEDRWKFRLRDEYKTACYDSPSSKPLFFLIGHFDHDVTTLASHWSLQNMKSPL